MAFVRMGASAGDGFVYVNTSDVASISLPHEAYSSTTGGRWDTCTVILRNGEHVGVRCTPVQVAVMLGLEKAPSPFPPIILVEHADGRVRHVIGSPGFWSTSDHHRSFANDMDKLRANGWKTVVR